MTTTQVHRNPIVVDRWYKTVCGEHEKVPSAEHGRGLRWRARWVDDDGIYRAKSFAREIDAQRWIDEEIVPISTAEIGGTVTVTTTKTGVFLYHDMRKHDDFDKTAQALFEIVQSAACKYPGRPRHLYLDIEGHRNSAGGYDPDAKEILGNFIQNFLGEYLTVFPTIGARMRNPNQCDDIPKKFAIQTALDIQTTETSTPESEGKAMSVPTTEELFRPVLVAADEPRTRGEIRALVADAIKLSDEDRRMMLKNGRKAVFDDHVNWAITFMNHSELLDKIPSRVQYGTQYVLTKLGREIVAEYPHIDQELLKEIGAWHRPFGQRRPKTKLEYVEPTNSQPEQPKFIEPIINQPLEAILLDALKAIRAIDGFKGGVERARETAHQALTDYEAAHRRPSSNGKRFENGRGRILGTSHT